MATYYVPDAEGKPAQIWHFVNVNYVFTNDQHIMKIIPLSF